jgi:hypothetical protein
MILRRIVCVSLVLCAAALSGTMLLNWLPAADHNDPNAVNSIFSDIDVSAADLYDLFGWPSDDTGGGEKVVIALTFAPIPKAGVFDSDMLYRKGLNIPLKRPSEIFIPNVCAIDMDTTGTWPYGRRPEDQVATRFLALFLDMKAELGAKKYHLDTLADQSLWNKTKIEPKRPPNPLKNDKPFLKEFPYLADPWPEAYGAR